MPVCVVCATVDVGLGVGVPVGCVWVDEGGWVGGVNVDMYIYKYKIVERLT